MCGTTKGGISLSCQKEVLSPVWCRRRFVRSWVVKQGVGARDKSPNPSLGGLAGGFIEDRRDVLCRKIST